MTITITLPKTDEKRLNSAALMYGFSVEELSRRIIADATSMFLDVPEESIGEYENAAEIKEAFRKAVESDRKGMLRALLPRSITRT